VGPEGEKTVKKLAHRRNGRLLPRVNRVKVVKIESKAGTSHPDLHEMYLETECGRNSRMSGVKGMKDCRVPFDMVQSTVGS